METDHLGTPRAVISPASNAIIWRWNLSDTAFGEHAPQNDPDGNGQTYTLNFRYPGQWYDAESGLNYNYFRDYDPATGRYVESDPIGLKGGMSTFAYAGGNPETNSDPFGLFVPWATFARPEVLVRPPTPRFGPQFPAATRLSPRGPGQLNRLAEGIQKGLEQSRQNCPQNEPFDPLAQAMRDLGIKPRGPLKPEIEQPLPLPSPPRIRQSWWEILGDILEGFGGDGGTNRTAPLAPQAPRAWEEMCRPTECA